MKTVSGNERIWSMFSKLTSAVGLFLLAALAGCSSGDKPAETPASTGTPGKIVIKGSNTIGEELGPRLIVEFKKAHPAAAFELESKGTGYGLAGLMAGQCDLAAASRPPIKDELDLAHSRGIELNDYAVGFYSVAVVVHANCPVADLTRDQVRDIFTGTVQNWKDVGGPDAAIHLCIRDPISGTYLGFKELAMENKPYAAGPKTCTNYAAIVEAVAQDPAAIGYASVELAAKPGVKAVSIGGVAPTLASVKEGKYPFQRALHFYSNKAKEAPAAHDFALFVQSVPGQAVLTETGFVPGP